MKTRLYILASALALVGCAAGEKVAPNWHPSPDSEPWSCEAYEAEGEPKVFGCISEANGGAWNGSRYIPLCQGKMQYPSRRDPWVAHYMALGNDFRSAQQLLSKERDSSDCRNR